MLIHKVAQRGLQYEVTYGDSDWQTRASANFALFFSNDSESFRPALDLGVYDQEDGGALLKAHYYLGRSGLLLVSEYMTAEDDDDQAIAKLLLDEPFKRGVDPYAEPMFNGIPGQIVGTEELDALTKVLHTNSEITPHNKVYEIPGHFKKS